VTSGSTEYEQIGWLLEDFRSRVEGLSHAVALSADGLVLAATSGLPTHRAVQLGAITSGLSALARGGAQLFGSGDVQQIVVEMDIGFLLVTHIDERACVATLATQNADLEQVGYEVTLLVDRVGKALAPLPRRSGPLGPESPAGAHATHATGGGYQGGRAGDHAMDTGR
jgi:uncharacterized protein